MMRPTRCLSRQQNEAYVMATTTTPTTPTAATTPTKSTAKSTGKPRVKKTVVPATLPQPTAKDPKTVAAAESTLSATAIQGLNRKALARALLTGYTYLTAYEEADAPTLAALASFGISDANLVLLGRWIIATLAVAQQRDANAAALADSVNKLASYNAGFRAQLKTLTAQLRLALAGNANAVAAFGLKKSPPKKKAVHAATPVATTTASGA